MGAFQANQSEGEQMFANMQFSSRNEKHGHHPCAGQAHKIMVCIPPNCHKFTPMLQISGFQNSGKPSSTQHVEASLTPGRQDIRMI